MLTRYLNEYLEIVVDLEKNIYIQKKTLQSMKAQSNRLAIPRDIPEPIEPQETSLDLLGTLTAGIILVFLFPVIRLMDDAYFQLAGSSAFIGFILALIALASIPGVFVGLFLLYSVFVEKKQIEQKKIDYLDAMRQYHREKEKEKSRLLAECLQKDALISEIRTMQEIQKHSYEVLNTVYSTNIIFPKYRNLIAVCSLYEYISSRRCDELVGSCGAYNLYEQELLADRIITQLDHISRQLSQLQQNQYILYQTICHGDSKSSQLLDANAQVLNRLQWLQPPQEQTNEGIDQLIANSDIGIYQRERIQKELEYKSRINSLTARNN